ncbi:MAG: universal stress protein [Bacteroidales bacterium]
MIMEEKKEYPILAPYDFTSVSDAAVDHAARFSQLSGQPVVVLNVVDRTTQKFLRLHNQMEQFLNIKLKDLCNDVANKYKIKISYMVRRSGILSIRRIAEELHASFMFIGIDQPHTVASNVFKVIAHSPAPVFVIQSDIEWKKIETIIFPVDEFEETRQKTACAIKLARLNKAIIKLFSITLNEKEHQILQTVRVKQIEKMLLENEVHFTTEYAKRNKKDFPDELLEYAQSNNTDIFILMKTPRTFFPNLFISKLDIKILMNRLNIPSIYVNPRDVGIYR